MAPVVSLPILEMQNLPDCRKRWADVEDSGTPSPWTEYALPDFKTWPPTPTPSVATPTGSGTGLPHLLGQQMRTGGMEAPFTALTQTCQTDGSEMLIAMQTPYVPLTQTCGPSLSEMVSVPSTTCQAGMAYPGYEVACEQGWGCEFNDLNGASLGGCYAVGVQWPSFALPQSSAVPETLPPSGLWADMNEDPNVQTKLEPQPSAQADEPKEVHHGAGQCRPCAWFWREQGCRNGAACGYCHLCPEGELKSRKKNKIAAMRMGALTPVKAGSQASAGWGLKLDSLIQENP